MTLIRSLWLALAALILASSSPTLARDAKAAVAAQGDLWNAAYNAGDWTALRALYSEDAWLMTDKAPAAKGADAIIAYLRRFRDMGATVTFKFENEDIRIEHRLAVVVAKYWMTTQLPGRPVIRTAGRSILIYRQQGKRWLLWRDMDNTTPDVTLSQ
jgi:ketosteroid isomerase-like protein